MKNRENVQARHQDHIALATWAKLTLCTFPLRTSKRALEQRLLRT